MNKEELMKTPLIDDDYAKQTMILCKHMCEAMTDEVKSSPFSINYEQFSTAVLTASFDLLVSFLDAMDNGAHESHYRMVLELMGGYVEVRKIMDKEDDKRRPNQLRETEDEHE